MHATLQVEKQKEGEFRVTVIEGTSRTTHTVTVDRKYWEKLTGGKFSVEDLVCRSLDFLLEREPKESILRSFDLPVIGRYFPDYEREMKRRLAS